MTDITNFTSSVIERYQLVPALRRIFEDGLTGVVRAKAKDGGKVRIYVDQGQPRLCVGTGPEHALGAYLLRSGLINSSQLRYHVKAAKKAELRMEEYFLRTGLVTEQRLHSLRLAMSHMVFGDAAAWPSVNLRVTPGDLPNVVAMFRLDIARAIPEYYLRWFRTDPMQRLAEGGCGLSLRHASQSVCRMRPDANSQDLAVIQTVFGEVGASIIRRLESGLRLTELASPVEAQCILAAMTMGGVQWNTDEQQEPQTSVAAGSSRNIGFGAKPPLGSLSDVAASSVETNHLQSLLDSHGLATSTPPPASTGVPSGRISEYPTAPPPTDAELAGSDDPLARALAEAVAVAAGQSETELSAPHNLGMSSSDEVDGIELDILSTETRIDTARDAEASATKHAVSITPERAAASKISAGPGLVPPPAAYRKPPEGAAAREVWDMRVKLSRSNHFTLLDLQPGVPLSFIRDRYVTLRAHFDPTVFADELSEDGIADLTLIGKTLDQVVDDLTDHESRLTIEAAVEGGMNEFQAQMYFDAERAWREAKRLADERDYAAASRFLDRAIELNGKEPEYAVWRAEMEWDRRIAEGRWDDDGRHWVRKRLSAVIEQHPRHIQARVVLARTLLELAKEADALELYRSVLSDQPRHVEAAGAVTQLEGQLGKSARSKGRGLFRRFKRDS